MKKVRVKKPEVEVKKSNISIPKARFTASDLKNDLYILAKSATAKNSDSKKVTAAIGGYRAILNVVNLEIKAAKLGLHFNG
jgi:hypothetical protein